MLRRARWHLSAVGILLLTAGCDAYDIASPGRDNASRVLAPQLSVIGGLQCTDPDSSGKVECTLNEGSAVWEARAAITSAPVSFVLRGASGGDRGTELVGAGGFTSATRVITPSTLLLLTAGGVGGNAGIGPAFGLGGANGGGNGGINTDTGFRGAGGGGASSVGDPGFSPDLVAGGGGGAGGDGGAVSGRAASAATGAARGGLAAFGGLGGQADNFFCDENDGQTGTPGQGGAGASTTDALLVFSLATFPCHPGSGGGGGWFGGGGGANSDDPGHHGGGGGSGRVDLDYAGVTGFSSTHTGPGQVKLTYYVHPPLVLVAVTEAIDASTLWYNVASSGNDGVDVNVFATPEAQSLQCDDAGTEVLLVRSATGSFTLGDGMHTISCAAGIGKLVGAGPGSTAMPLLLNVDQTAPTLNVSFPSQILFGSSAAATVTATNATWESHPPPVIRWTPARQANTRSNAPRRITRAIHAHRDPSFTSCSTTSPASSSRSALTWSTWCPQGAAFP